MNKSKSNKKKIPSKSPEKTKCAAVNRKGKSLKFCNNVSKFYYVEKAFLLTFFSLFLET